MIHLKVLAKLRKARQIGTTVRVPDKKEVQELLCLSDEALDLYDRADWALRSGPASYEESMADRLDLVERLTRTGAVAVYSFPEHEIRVFQQFLCLEAFDFWRAVRDYIGSLRFNQEEANAI